MRRLFALLFTLLSICSSSSSSSSSASSSKGYSGESNSDREVIQHAINFGSHARGGGGFRGGRSPGVGEGGSGGSGSSSPRVPGGAAVVPVITGAGANRNRQGGHRSRASCTHSCAGLQPLVKTMLAVLCVLVCWI